MLNEGKEITRPNQGRNWSAISVEISAYSKDWPQLFEQEKSLIFDKVEPGLFPASAFGSTSIPRLSTKDTIDMFMEVDFEEINNQKLIYQLNALGYEANWQNEGGYSHLVFFKDI